MQRSKRRRYSTTSAAIACSVNGTLRPSALAALRLMIGLEFCGLYDRQVSWLLALKNPAGVNASLTVRIWNAALVARQTASET
jgi:hypothetical protein